MLAGAEGTSFLESPASEFAAPLVDEDDGAEDASLEDAARRRLPHRARARPGRHGRGLPGRARRRRSSSSSVAIKLLRARPGRRRDARALPRERQILARCTHPHIARLLDGGVTADGRPYFVMEYVDGVPHRRYCATRSGSTSTARCGCSAQVCDGGRSYAHRTWSCTATSSRRTSWSRRTGELKLLDFGIAKLLDAGLATQRPSTRAPGCALMTPDYAAPEQVRGEPVTTADRRVRARRGALRAAHRAPRPPLRALHAG